MTTKNFFKFQPRINNGLISFNIKNKTTKVVTDFYGIEPFPNYSKNEDIRSLLEKGNKNDLSKQLKEFIGLNKSFV